MSNLSMCWWRTTLSQLSSDFKYQDRDKFSRNRRISSSIVNTCSTTNSTLFIRTWNKFSSFNLSWPTNLVARQMLFLFALSGTFTSMLTHKFSWITFYYFLNRSFVYCHWCSVRFVNLHLSSEILAKINIQINRSKEKSWKENCSHTFIIEREWNMSWSRWDCSKRKMFINQLTQWSGDERWWENKWEIYDCCCCCCCSSWKWKRWTEKFFKLISRFIAPSLLSWSPLVSSHIIHWLSIVLRQSGNSLENALMNEDGLTSVCSFINRSVWWWRRRRRKKFTTKQTIKNNRLS